MAEPVYAIIEDFYSPEELSAIWSELNILLDNDMLLDPNATGSAIDVNKNLIKNNKALWLDAHYIDRETSKILQINRKIFNKQLTDDLVSHNPIFRFLQSCNYDSTMISYYETGHYYKPHVDLAVFTVLTYFFKEPKKFTGGDFKLVDFDITITPKNNMVVIMPSCYLHQATDVIIEEKGYGRFCMSQFIGFK
jgi:Rps23 Pro-64 3,4-dihydroxylase Tpa1-like proline 4-hydroxylase